MQPEATGIAQDGAAPAGLRPAPGLEAGRVRGPSIGDRKRPIPASASISAIFFLSGFAGLLYEVVWLRSFVAVVGATVTAVSTVLTIFFAGLALGSWYFGKRAGGRGEALRLYGKLELGLGAFALFVPLLFAVLDDVYVAFFRAVGGSHAFLTGFRVVLAGTVLLWPTALMGGTLPVISRAFVADAATPARGVGWLYGLNTSGAVLGTLVTGYVLIEQLGVRATNWLGAAVSVAVGLLAIRLSRRLAGVGEASGESRPGASAGLPSRAGSAHCPLPTAHSDFDPRPVPPSPWPLLAAFTLTGFAAMGLEVCWTRTLVFALSSSTYAFSTMLAIFLMGLAIGSLCFARRTDRQEDALGQLAIVVLLIAPLTLLPLYLFHDIPALLRYVPGTLAAVLLMGPATLLMGGTFPLGVRLVAGPLPALAGDVGRLYAFNTVGGALGSLVTGFALIPLLGGVRPAVLALVALETMVGLGLLVLGRQRAAGSRQQAAGGGQLAGGRVRLAGAGAVAATLALSLLLPLKVELRSGQEAAHYGVESLLAYREGAAGTVKVFRDRQGFHHISIDGFPVGGTSPEMMSDQKMLAHLPLLLHPAPRRALTVGFGTGGTSYSMLQHPDVEVHCVELLPEVPAVQRFFPECNHGVLQGHPRYRLLLHDARNYIMATDTAYDVIVTDCTDLTYSSNANLYSRDFFKLCRRRLNPGGLVAVWTPLQLARQDYEVLLATFRAVFPHTTVWFMSNFFNHYVIVVGTAEPLTVDYRALRERIRGPVREDLEEIRLADPAKLMATLVVDEAGLARWLSRKPIHTEDRPLLEFSAARNAEVNGLTANLYYMKPYRPDAGEDSGYGLSSPQEMLARLRNAEGEQRRLTGAWSASRAVFDGFHRLAHGDWLGALAHYRLAEQFDPADEAALRALIHHSREYLIRSGFDPRRLPLP